MRRNNIINTLLKVPVAKEEKKKKNKEKITLNEWNMVNKSSMHAKLEYAMHNELHCKMLFNDTHAHVAMSDV